MSLIAKKFWHAIIPPNCVPGMEFVRFRFPTSLPRLRSRAAVVAFVLATVGVFLSGQALYIHAKAVVAQVLLRQAFAETIATGQPVKPWSWADTWPVARIQVPRLGAEAIVLAGASGQALAFGPGHIPNTKMPGQSGTAVFAAHRDTHFDFLGELKIGDKIYITRKDGEAFVFSVFNMKVEPWNRNGINIDSEGENIVLATCWPLDAKIQGNMRYLVYARVQGNESL